MPDPSPQPQAWLDHDDEEIAQEFEVPGWSHRLVVEQVPNPGVIVLGANRHYRRPKAFSVPVFQLTYDDRRGWFPWDAGYAIPAWVQPRPGMFTACAS
jgi:hypothetical protein